jgi:hypothetical protein
MSLGYLSIRALQAFATGHARPQQLFIEAAELGSSNVSSESTGGDDVLPRPAERADFADAKPRLVLVINVLFR